MDAEYSAEKELEITRQTFPYHAGRVCEDYHRFENREKQYPVKHYELAREIGRELHAHERPVDEILKDVTETFSIFALPFIVDALNMADENDMPELVRKMNHNSVGHMIDHLFSWVYTGNLAHYPSDPEECENIDKAQGLLKKYGLFLQECGFDIPTHYHTIR